MNLENTRNGVLENTRVSVSPAPPPFVAGTAPGQNVGQVAMGQAPGTVIGTPNYPNVPTAHSTIVTSAPPGVRVVQTIDRPVTSAIDPSAQVQRDFVAPNVSAPGTAWPAFGGHALAPSLWQGSDGQNNPVQYVL